MSIEKPTLHEKMDMIIERLTTLEDAIKVTYEKSDGVHYAKDSSESPLYVPDPIKPYDKLVNAFGGANRLAEKIEQDPEWAATRPELTDFRNDWPMYFNLEFRQKWYGISPSP